MSITFENLLRLNDRARSEKLVGSGSNDTTLGPDNSGSEEGEETHVGTNIHDGGPSTQYLDKQFSGPELIPSQNGDGRGDTHVIRVEIYLETMGALQRNRILRIGLLHKVVNRVCPTKYPSESARMAEETRNCLGCVFNLQSYRDRSVSHCYHA